MLGHRLANTDRVLSVARDARKRHAKNRALRATRKCRSEAIFSLNGTQCTHNT